MVEAHGRDLPSTSPGTSHEASSFTSSSRLTVAELLKKNEELTRELSMYRSDQARRPSGSTTDPALKRQLDRLSRESSSLRIQLAEEREENRILQSERDRLQAEKRALVSQGKSVSVHVCTCAYMRASYWLLPLASFGLACLGLAAFFFLVQVQTVMAALQMLLLQTIRTLATTRRKSHGSEASLSKPRFAPYPHSHAQRHSTSAPTCTCRACKPRHPPLPCCLCAWLCLAAPA